MGTGILWTIFIILLVLWLLGVVSSYLLGATAQVLLVVAVVAMVYQLVASRHHPA